MLRSRLVRLRIMTAGMGIAALMMFALNISLGSVHIPLGDLLGRLFGADLSNNIHEKIIWQFRLPKALAGILAGAGLGTAGLIMQTLFRNPLAGPFVLGVSSGASLGVALVIMTGIAFFTVEPGGWMMIIAASAGALLIMLLILAVSYRTRDNMTLLILGLMIGSVATAVISILQFFSNSEQIQVYLLWTFGSLSGLSWNEINMLIPLVAVGIIVAWLLSKPMNTFLMSENYALSMGVNTQRIRVLIIISTSILAGAVTAFCGPIAFIGIAIPHLTRIILNTSDHRWLLPGVIFGGIIVLLVCDIIATLPGYDKVLPINAITSLFGAPVVIWLILSKKKISKTFGG